MGNKSRTKGLNFERDVAEKLREAGYHDAKRGLGQADGARKIPDIEGTPFWIECKVGKRPPIEDAMRQAMYDAEDANDLRTELVISKKDFGDVLVTIRFDDFIWLAKKAGF